MSQRWQAGLVVCVVLSLCMCVSVHAKKEAAPGYINAPPVLTGVVTQFLVNPFGEVDGLLLDNSVVITFPPHMEGELTAALKPGDPVTIKGHTSGPAQVKAFVLTNTRTNQQVIEHPRPKTERKILKHLRAGGLQQMRVRGTVRQVRYDKHGEEIEGVILEDGTSVRFSDDAVEEVEQLLRVGQALEVVGYGSENSYGRGLEATEIGVPGQTLRRLYDPIDKKR